MLTTTILLHKSEITPGRARLRSSANDDRESLIAFRRLHRGAIRISFGCRKKKKNQRERETERGGGREREIIAPALNLHPISNTTRG